MDNQEIVKNQYSASKNLDSRLGLHSYNVNKYDWHEWCFDNMRIPNGARILELGCGNGMLWEKNSDKIHDSWDIILSDLSAGLFEAVKE
jgi:ubiquinone/menaquinone biosynthesis C-methylase UbiE